MAKVIESERTGSGSKKKVYSTNKWAAGGRATLSQLWRKAASFKSCSGEIGLNIIMLFMRVLNALLFLFYE